uniref:Uncharacterized protein n=1 Tax=Candidatus Berkiella aquae TaxID=295108 RepID=A0A0Q9YUX2_9GAMM
MLEKVHLENIRTDRTNATLVLESENRSGEFMFYDFLNKKVVNYSIHDLFSNEKDILRIDYHDIFQIGISSGRRQYNSNLLKQFFMCR